MLPTPSSNCIDKIKDLLYKFMWNNKRDKIKRKVMNQDYKLGECRMTDITIQNKALKLSWIPTSLKTLTLSGFTVHKPIYMLAYC